MKVYLGGNISADPESYAWRNRVTELLKPEFTVYDPCKNTYNQTNIKYHEGGGESFTKFAISQSQQILRTKDYQAIKGCDMALFNMTVVDPEKPPMGTIHEIVWCHDIFYIPVVAIIGDGLNIYCRHPWNRECFSAELATEVEAVDFIKFFFMMEDGK